MEPIDRNSWHFKRYEWWWYKTEASNFRKFPKQVNLCPYIRAVIFWYTIRYIFNDGWQKLVLGVTGIWIIFNLIIYHFDGLKGIKITNQVAFFTLIIIGAFAGIMHLWICTKEAILNSKWYSKEKVDKGPTFWSITKEAIKGIHNKVCPILGIKKEF